MKVVLSVVLGVIVVGMLSARSAEASPALTLTVDSITKPSPTSVTNGVLNITCSISGSINPTSGYQVEVDLIPVGNAQGMSFASPYEQNGANPVYSQGPNNFLGSASEIQTGLDLPFNTSVPITSGQVLVQLEYQLAAGASGVYDVNINPADTFVDDNSTPTTAHIAYSVTNGVVTLTPEPSSACLLLACAAWPLLRRPR